MKHLKKIIAVILTAILISSVALPIVSFAENGVPNDHTSFEDFWDQMTDDEGNVDWRQLPKTLFKVYFWVRLIEAISEFFRGIFGFVTPTTAPDLPADEVTTIDAQVETTLAPAIP